MVVLGFGKHTCWVRITDLAFPSGVLAFDDDSQEAFSHRLVPSSWKYRGSQRKIQDDSCIKDHHGAMITSVELRTLQQGFGTVNDLYVSVAGLGCVNEETSKPWISCLAVRIRKERSFVSDPNSEMYEDAFSLSNANAVIVF